MRFRGEKRNYLLWFQIWPLFLAAVFFTHPAGLSAKELAPHKIFGHLLSGDEIVQNLNAHTIEVRLNRNDTIYIVARYEGVPLYGDYFVVTIPIDDAQKEGIPSPGEKVELITDGFSMVREIELCSGRISRQDIRLCTYTGLELVIEGVSDGADYHADVIPIIRTRGCGVTVQATLNGTEFTSGTVITEYDHYTLEVMAEDASGQSRYEQVSFTRSGLQADELNGDFSEGLSEWSIEGNDTLISLTDQIVIGPGGYAVTIDPPGFSEQVMLQSDLLYVRGGSIMDVSFYLYGRAGDQILLQVTSYSDRFEQNPLTLIGNEILSPTVDYGWQRVSRQLIIPEHQYFVQISLGRNENTNATSPLTVDKISLAPVPSIATTVADSARNLWIAVEEGGRNLVSGLDSDLGIFDDATLATVGNLPGSTYGLKYLKLKQAGLSRNIYLPSGTYTLSFMAWADTPGDFLVEIGSTVFTRSAGLQAGRHEVTVTLPTAGWYILGFNHQNSHNVYITQIQLEEGDLATSYTPSGRSNGYLRFTLQEEQKMDFGQAGTLSLVFSPELQGEDLFLAGCRDGGWAMEYRTGDKSLAFSMQNEPDLCTMQLGPDGLMADEIYQVVLFWDTEKITYSLYHYGTSSLLGSSESTLYNRNIQCDAFSLGSKLAGINQTNASHSRFGPMYYETTCPEGCLCRYTLTHDLSIPSLPTLPWMSEVAGAYLALNHVPSAPSLHSPASLSEVATLTPTLTINNSNDLDADPLTYEFELYPNADLTPPALFTVSGVAEGETTTSWAGGVTLQKKTWYSWRARAFDGVLLSPWMEGAAFFVNPVNIPPSALTISLPVDQGEVDTVQPQLVVTNGLDPDGDSLHYEFEVYADEAMMSLTASGAMDETPGTTAWIVPMALYDNTWYYWRVRAADGEGFSDWVSSSFFVNTINDSPLTPTLLHPADGAWVEVLTPVLEVNPSSDIDHDSLLYRFEVYGDASLSNLIFQQGIQACALTIPTPLNDHPWYYWRVQAEDEHGAVSGWMETASFFINNQGINDPPQITLLTPSQNVLMKEGSLLIQWEDHDPDSQAEIALYYDNDQSGGDGVLIQDNIAEDPDGADDTFTWSISALPDGTFYLYAVIRDEQSSSTSYSPGAVIIDTTPPTISVQPPGGVYELPQTIVLTASEPADIYYTLDGSEPTTASSLYTLPLEIRQATAALKCMAVDTIGNVSIVFTHTYTITDTDADGMSDDWERTHFGDLGRDGTGDFDNDGVSDLDEFLNQTDPTSSNAPTTPSLHSPLDGAEVTSVQPDLTIQNSTDPDGDVLTYAFEVYGDQELTNLVVSRLDVPEGVGLTLWQVPQALCDNTWYYWRVRAADGAGVSPWAYGRFFVNTQNDAPSPFNISSPQDGSEVDTLRPTLQVTNSHDLDEDVITYTFNIYADSGLLTLVASASNVLQGGQGTTSWQVTSDLGDNTWYWWQAVAIDEHGASTRTSVSTFFVNTANDAPQAPTIISPVDGSEVTFLDLTLAAGNSYDLDGDILTYSFELDTLNTFDSGQKRVSGEVEEGIDTTIWAVSGLLDNTWYYWRVKASDGLAESPWSQGSFFTNTENDLPTTPTLKNPGDGAWVETLTPQLEINPSQDQDHDAISYLFEVYNQPLLENPIAQGFSENPGWTVPSPLNDNTWYWWRVLAEDEHGAVSGWMNTARFFINNNGFDDPPHIAIIEPQNNIILTSGSTTIQWEDSDPDSNALISLYYDTDAMGGDGVLIAADLAEDPDGAGDTFLWNITGMPYGTYYIYAVITDGISSETCYSVGSITVGPDAPVADFTSDVTSGAAPLTVHFTDTSTGIITSWFWDFGDGGTSTEANPTHSYDLAGTYSVSLTVANATGSDTMSRVDYLTVTDTPSTQVHIVGGAYNYPEGGLYMAIISMYVTGPANPSGWLNYYYIGTLMNFESIQITEVSTSGDIFTIEGAGTVNGVGGYTFTATVSDGAPDSFGFTIKRSDGSIFYTAGHGAITGGDLVILAF